MEAGSGKTLWMALDWIEAHCVVPDGFRKGQPFKLYKYQGQYLANFYLVRDDAEWVPNNPILAPAFVYRRGLLVGPQKVGKNPLIAAQVCLEGVGPALFAGWAGKDEGYACVDHGCHCGWEKPYEPGEPKGMAWPTPLVQITAFSQDSTDNTYDALRPMIELGSLADLIPKTGEEFIRLPGGGQIDTVTSSNQSRLGARATFVPQDELGLWTAANKMVKLGDTQYRNLSGMGGRASLTSNAWDPTEHSVAQLQYESTALDVYRQFTIPPKTLSYGNKRDRAKIHRIVYPPDTLKEQGGHVDLDSIENEAADLVERDLSQAVRFYGNGLVAGAGAAVDPDVWDSLARPGGWPPAGTYIGLGFDGSVSRDATALVGCTAEGYSFLIKAWVRPAGADLALWKEAHPGEPEWRVIHKEVNEEFDVARTRWRVGRVRADPPKWQTDIESWQETLGKDAEGDLIVQPLDTFSAVRMAPAVDRWLTGIETGVHTHDGDPILAEHVKAVHKKQVRLHDDPADARIKYLLIKGSDGRKIDAAIADVLAYEAAMTMAPAPAPREWGAFVA